MCSKSVYDRHDTQHTGNKRQTDLLDKAEWAQASQKDRHLLTVATGDRQTKQTDKTTDRKGKRRINK